MSQAESHPQDGPATAEGWKLLRKVLREQRRGLLQGVVIGLMWSAGNKAVHCCSGRGQLLAPESLQAFLLAGEDGLVFARADGLRVHCASVSSHIYRVCTSGITT